MPKRKGSSSDSKVGGSKRGKKKKAPKLSPLEQAIFDTKHIAPKSFNGVEGSSSTVFDWILVFPLEESE